MSAVGPDLDDASEVHHRDAVRDRPRESEVVRDHQDRQMQLVTQLHEERQDLPAHRRVEVRHRFVGDDHRWIQGEGAGDHDPLTLPAGELVGVPSEEQASAAASRRETARSRPAVSSVSPFGPCETPWIRSPSATIS